MNKTFKQVTMSGPGVAPYASVPGYLDNDGKFYKFDDVVDHPCNKDKITYNQLEPEKYRLVYHSEPIDNRAEFFDPDFFHWLRTSNSPDVGYNKTLTYRLALDLPSPIAAGYNPLGLTEEQVGVKEAIA